MEHCDGVDSVVRVVGCPDGTRYYVLIYPSWPCETVEVFHFFLSCILPAGSRWYGGYFSRVVSEWEVEGYPFDLFWDRSERCHIDRWIEVLVDFGGVDRHVSIDPMLGFFSVFGVYPVVSPCRDDAGYEEDNVSKFMRKEMELQTAGFAQRGIAEQAISTRRFGQILLKQCGNV